MFDLGCRLRLSSQDWLSVTPTLAALRPAPRAGLHLKPACWGLRLVDLDGAVGCELRLDRHLELAALGWVLLELTVPAAVSCTWDVTSRATVSCSVAPERPWRRSRCCLPDVETLERPAASCG